MPPQIPTHLPSTSSARYNGLYIKQIEINLDGTFTLPIPETPKETIQRCMWLLFCDMLARNATFYYFIYTIISTNRDLNVWLQMIPKYRFIKIANKS